MGCASGVCLTDEKSEEPVKMLYDIFEVPVLKQIVESTRTSSSKRTYRRTRSGSKMEMLQSTLNSPERGGGDTNMK